MSWQISLSVMTKSFRTLEETSEEWWGHLRNPEIASHYSPIWAQGQRRPRIITCWSLLSSNPFLSLPFPFISSRIRPKMCNMSKKVWGNAVGIRATNLKPWRKDWPTINAYISSLARAFFTARICDEINAKSTLKLADKTRWTFKMDVRRR